MKLEPDDWLAFAIMAGIVLLIWIFVKTFL
jgi:hypothetical protein